MCTSIHQKLGSARMKCLTRRPILLTSIFYYILLCTACAEWYYTRTLHFNLLLKCQVKEGIKFITHVKNSSYFEHHELQENEAQSSEVKFYRASEGSTISFKMAKASNNCYK